MKHLYLSDGKINPELYEKKVIIYGCGNDGKKLFLLLQKLGKNVECFVDSNCNLWGTRIYETEVRPYEGLENIEDFNLALAFHQYPQVLNMLPEKIKNNVFADFLYEHKGKRKCIVCECEDCTYDLAHFAPFLQERMFLEKQVETKLIHCLNCDLYFSDYRPNDEEMARLYSGYRDELYVSQRMKYEPSYCNERNNDEQVLVNRKKRVVDFLSPYVDYEKVVNLLDYGGDKGQVIPEVFCHTNKYVYDISGNPTLPGITLLSNIDNVKEIEWDLVMCMQLLEHVSDPVNVIKILNDILRKDSYLYVELPYQDYMLQYSDVEINEHINFYRETTMKKIAEICNLKVINIDIEEKRIIKVLYQK